MLKLILIAALVLPRRHFATFIKLLLVLWLSPALIVLLVLDRI